MKFFRVKPAKERKVVFLRKRWLAIPGALLCICALCLVTTLPSYVSASTTERQLPIYCVQRDYKTCALSFDAAWGNEDTQTLIDIFDKYNVKVTFFVVGEWVDKYPESVKALAGCRPRGDGALQRPRPLQYPLRRSDCGGHQHLQR